MVVFITSFSRSSSQNTWKRSLICSCHLHFPWIKSFKGFTSAVHLSCRKFFFALGTKVEFSIYSFIPAATVSSATVVLRSSISWFGTAEKSAQLLSFPGESELLPGHRMELTCHNCPDFSAATNNRKSQFPLAELITFFFLKKCGITNSIIQGFSDTQHQPRHLKKLWAPWWSTHLHHYKQIPAAME